MSAVGAAYLFFSCFLFSVSHNFAGHPDDKGFDLEWIPYILLDLIMVLIFLKYLRYFAAGLLWIAVLFQIFFIYVEPHSAPDLWREQYYDPYFYPVFVVLLVLTLMPIPGLESSTGSSRLRSRSSTRR